MKSNYKRIGDHIRLVDKRNRDLKVDLLLGLSITKNFIPSVANIVGTNMATYKIIKKNQFACSIMQVRRDKKMPIALLKDFDEAIISQAYPVFEIIDESLLLPEYLMMWFSRSEFDRHACFLAVGGVRGSLEWEDFLDMELPVPSIEKQRAIVKEYNTVVNRIELNEQLNLKLEETAQAIYKEWFVDFEFPNEDGEPYKSAGGKMVWNDDLDKEVPEGWEETYLNQVMNIKHGYAYKGDYITLEESDNVLLSPGNFKIGGGFKGDSFKYYTGEVPKDYIFNTGDIMVTMTDLSKAGDTLGYPALIPKIKGKYLLHNQRLGKVELIDKYNYKYFFYWLMRLKSYRNEVIGSATGTTVRHTSPTRIMEYKFAIPENLTLLNEFENLIKKVQRKIEQHNDENQNLLDLKDLLLTKMSKV